MSSRVNRIKNSMIMELQMIQMRATKLFTFKMIIIPNAAYLELPPLPTLPGMSLTSNYTHT
jgi:hypothetical protein